MQQNTQAVHKGKAKQHKRYTKQSNKASTIMVSFKVIFLAAAICVLLFEAATASQLSIFKGPNCMESPLKETIDCTDGRGVGDDHACINFGDYDISYTFKYQGTPFKLYYGAGCGGHPAVFSNDIGCTQVANAKSYKVLCNSKGY